MINRPGVTRSWYPCRAVIMCDVLWSWYVNLDGLSSIVKVERYKAGKKLQVCSVYLPMPYYNGPELQYKPPRTMFLIGALSKHQTLLLLRRACNYAIQPRQRLYSSSVRLHPHRCPGLTAADCYAARECPRNDPGGLQPPLLACFRGGRVLVASSCHEWWISSVMHRFPERRS